MNYRRDIDGLRGVAIVPVVLFHAGVPGFGGGFVGVDVFFVISGYLITGLLAEQLEAGRLSLRQFYERRIRRLFPALFVVVSCVWIAAFCLFLPRDLEQVGKTCLATLLFVANIFFFTQSGYFDTAADTKPLWHAWSLSVEEQFYFVFPLLLIGVHRWYPGRVVRAIALVTAVSFVAGAYATFVFPKAAFYMMPLRMWELGVGALVALGAFREWTRTQEHRWPGYLGLALILVPTVLYDPKIPFPGLAAVPPTVGAALLLGRAGSAAHARRFLESRVMRFFGLVSYSLYLWHWPIFVFAEYYFFPTPLGAWMGVAIGVAVGVATLSWRFVERRFHRPMARQPQASVLPAAAALTAALAACSAVLIVGRGLPSRLPEGARWYEAAQDFNRRGALCHNAHRHSVAIGKSCVYGDESRAPSYAIWSDSFGVELVAAIGHRLRPDRQSILQLTTAACPPSLGFSFEAFDGCPDRNAAILKFLRADTSIATVILVANYRFYSTPTLRKTFEPGFRDAVARLVDAGKSVWIVYPIPVPKVSVPKVVALNVMRGKHPGSFRIDASTYRSDNAETMAFLDTLLGPHVRKIDVTSVLCEARSCATFADGRVLYMDESHLSLAGAHYVAPVFEPVFGGGPVRLTGQRDP